jgi:restriction system protein
MMGYSMTLPSFQNLMLPVLQSACGRPEDISISELEREVARSANLDAGDLARLLPGGKKGVFANRISWARSYLCKAGLLEIRRKGFVQATERGRSLIEEGVSAIDSMVLGRYPEFSKLYPTGAGALARVGEVDENSEDVIVANYHRLNAELAREIIKRVHSFKPSFFERLIVDLLVKMGYGGGRLEMGRTLGRTGDGGVDGVIKEDELGLDVVYVQAKRFAEERSVPLREVRDFVGGLEGHRASKGVFVTTSYFPSTAYEFITRVSKRVVLIDGPELANLMIRHRVGVRVKASYDVKRIDEDYFVD